MMSIAAAEIRPLARALERLGELGVCPKAAEALGAAARDAEKALVAAAVKQVPGFSDSRNPRVLPELREHWKRHVEELGRLFGGGELGDFAFVRAHAHLRAEQRFPLEATLHAYRCARRVLSRWLGDAAAAAAAAPKNLEPALAAVADFAADYIDAISAVMTAEYVARTRLVSAAEGDRRAELLNALLSGHDEADGRMARLLKSAGYLDERQTYCVVAARSVLASEMEQPERARRIVASLADLVNATPIKALGGVRNAVAIAVMSASRRQSGWTAPLSSLAERLHGLLRQWGPAVLVGVSSDQPSTSSIPRALREALAALEFVSVDRRVVLFSELPLRSLIAHAGGEYVRSTAPAWTSALFAADAKARGTLLATLSALADEDLNIQAAGRRLGVHPNTVYARLSRIRDLTGLDGQRFHHLLEMLLAADCTRV